MAVPSSYVDAQTTVATFEEGPERDNGDVGKTVVSRESVPYCGGQLLDMYEPELPRPAAVVVMWHGSGANERVVLEPLARQIASSGVRVIVPDWSSDDEANGRNHLTASLSFVGSVVSKVRSVDGVVLAGWSLGASAGLTAVRHPEVVGGWRPTAFVGISGGFHRTPFSESESEQRVPAVDPSIPLVLVHGSSDEVVPIERSRVTYDHLLGEGWSVTLQEVPTDHAGAIGTVYDPTRLQCVPAEATLRREVLATVAGVIANLALAGR
jgi:predicted peptidase